MVEVKARHDDHVHALYKLRQKCLTSVKMLAQENHKRLSLAAVLATNDYTPSSRRPSKTDVWNINSQSYREGKGNQLLKTWLHGHHMMSIANAAALYFTSSTCHSYQP